METTLAQAFGQDMTQLAADERQRLLSRLLGRLAHEIRNPLSSLHIHVQLLEEDLAQADPVLRDKLTPRLEIIHGELHRLENLVKHFLGLSGPSELNLAPVDVGKMAEYVRDLLTPEAGARKIEIAVTVSDALPPVMADEMQLTQALVNLLINALQAVEQKGRIELNVDAPAGFLLIEVRDTGPGISPEKMASIFEPYYTTKEDGTGLGLWIVRQIAAAHGGDIHAANLPEGGAAFVLRLPLRKPEEPPGG